MTEDHWPEPTRFNLLFRLEKAAKEIETEGANHRWAVTCREASQALHNTQCLVMAARAEIACLTDAGAENDLPEGVCLAHDGSPLSDLCPTCGEGPCTIAPPPAAADRGVPGQRVSDVDLSYFLVNARYAGGAKKDDQYNVGLDLRDCRAALATAPKAEDVRREERERLHALMWAHVCALPVLERAAWVAPMGFVRRGRLLADAEKLANVEKFLSEDKQDELKQAREAVNGVIIPDEPDETMQ